MRLIEAKTLFINYLKSQEIGDGSQFPDHTSTDNDTPENPDLEACERSLTLLTDYFPNPDLEDVTVSRLRGFLAHWYVEEATAYALNEEARRLPDTEDLLATLRAFFQWTRQYVNDRESSNRLSIVEELQESVPRAIALGVALSKAIANRGGAFLFPEFLTSFEAGGHSEYDVGTGGETRARESYFRITKIAENKVEVDDVLLEDCVAPIFFPSAVVPFLKENYIINLELVYKEDGWHILQCGFAYPPNTDI